MERPDNSGLLGIDYAKARETRISYRYRLLRRTKEVLSAIERFGVLPVGDIIDLGAADGRMLDMIHSKRQTARCVGVEYSGELVRYARERFPGLTMIHGDIQSIPLPEDSFDVAIACAVIEHVPDPPKAMREARRVLRDGGILVMTSPDPFWERIAAATGQLEKGKHHHVMGLDELRSMAKDAGLSVLAADKFMLSPIGMPFEEGIEAALKVLRLDFVLSNQLLVAKR